MGKTSTEGGSGKSAISKLLKAMLQGVLTVELPTVSKGGLEKDRFKMSFDSFRGSVAD